MRVKMARSAADNVQVLEGPVDTQKPAALEWALERHQAKMTSNCIESKQAEARRRSAHFWGPVLIYARESYRSQCESGRHATRVNSSNSL